jgi:hypothetical protein
MPRKLLAALLAALLAVSACTSTVKQHHLGLDVKRHVRGAQPFPINPYKIDWEDCIIDVVPLKLPGVLGKIKDKYDKGNDLLGKAEYIINFPNTLKRLQSINVYGSPRDAYIAFEAFPLVNFYKDCLPPPDTIPTTYPSNPPPVASQPTSPPPSQSTGPSPTPPSPPPTTPPPDTTCVMYDGVTCTSSDPIVDFDVTNTGDTSDCTFTVTITWGDGSPDTTVGPFPGADNTLEGISDHTYTTPGTYSLSSTGVVDSGDCTVTPGSSTFTYVT